MATLQMRNALVAFCLMAVTLTQGRSLDKPEGRAINPENTLPTPELVARYGYPIESHTVQTQDGYLLTLHRIPGGKGGASADKGPVILQHGLLCSSADWIYTGPEKSFAFLLADAGYDVWLGNSRGNTYSRKHVSISPSNNDFWKFSWHEMGKYDIPAVVDYILSRTGYPNVFYIGHSQGTTQFYVMGSERPDYNSKIRAMFSLAPIAYMSNMKSPLIQLASKVGDELGFLLNLMGIYEFLPKSELLSLIGQLFCNDVAITQEICSNVLFLIGGYSSDQLNRTLLPAILGHTPAGASTRQLVHYGQEVESGRFRQYDFGLITNLIKYGGITPPNYDLSKITAPVALLYSDNDWLAAIVDVEKLGRELANVISMYRVPLPSFNHLDFMWAIDAPSLVYDEVLKLMAQY